MLDNFKTGGNEPPFLFGLYEIYCTVARVKGQVLGRTELSKNASQTESTTDLTMVHQYVFAELVLTQGITSK